MTQRMIRLFNTVTEARTYVKEIQSISLAKAKTYVHNNTANKIGNKVWVILP